MARLNIYVPDELHARLERWRERMNFSEICARALQDELAAAEAHRGAPGLLEATGPQSALELALARRWPLKDVVVAEGSGEMEELREILGREAARYLEARLCHGALIGLAGGRQMWCVVRNLSPRPLRLRATALGLQHNDPHLLHAHPNTLVTVLSLLYSPHADAKLVGSTAFQAMWDRDVAFQAVPTYFVVASCADFTPESPFAALLDPASRQCLVESGAVTDFAYVFLDASGEPIVDLRLPVSSVLTPESLRNLVRRSDARIILVAGGAEKLESIRLVINAGLCDTLITDDRTAGELLRGDGGL